MTSKPLNLTCIFENKFVVALASLLGVAVFFGGFVFILVQADKGEQKTAAKAEGLELHEYEARFPRTREGYWKRKLELLEAIAGRIDRIETRVDALEKSQDSTDKKLD